MLQRGAREFLEKECATAEVRRLEDSPQGFSRDLWRQMADLGWLGLTIPEEFGGLGAELLDQALICEEIGRALLPGLTSRPASSPPACYSTPAAMLSVRSS